MSAKTKRSEGAGLQLQERGLVAKRLQEVQENYMYQNQNTRGCDEFDFIFLIHFILFLEGAYIAC